jgi:predicted Ser/Thr protein kinase
MKIIQVLKDNPPLSPITRLVEYEGRKTVWKDYSERSCWVKDTWGRLLIRHEAESIKRLTGIKGIPRLIKTVGEYGFLQEYIDGEPLKKFRKETLPFSVFDKMSNLVETLHQRGVVHLDLGQKKNILLDKDYNPYFIDFANALYFRQEALGFNGLFKALCLIDYSALLKFKHRFFPETLTEKEKRWLKWFFFSRHFWILKPKTYRQKDKIKI